jgi:hypothetical protein
MTRTPALRLVPAAAIALAALAASPVRAHVGSPDVFYEGTAGPYRLLVTIRPPAVVPGVAEVQVRAADRAVRELRLVPLLMTGPGSEHAPTPDVADRSRDDPQFFTGHLWLMTAGAWQVRLLASGERGEGELAVPVPALPERTLGMRPALETLLTALLVLLVAGIVGIVGAFVREAGLEPGSLPAERERTRARRSMVGAAVSVLALVYLGNLWWDAATSDYALHVYTPLELDPSVARGTLTLRLRDPASFGARRVDDLVPDHDHLMHLYVVKLPGMERVWHLHPEQRRPGVFEHALPAMPAGRYALFADVVHRTGLAETATAELDVPAATTGAALSGDDAAGEGPPLSCADPSATTAPIESGRVVWDRPPSLRAKEVVWLRFRVLDAASKPAEDMGLYMGMLGHLAILERNRGVFAHIHPSGSVAMGALALIAPPGAAPPCHEAASARPPATIGFPYGFPKAGDYRLFLQFRRGGRIETAVFDVRVSD